MKEDNSITDAIKVDVTNTEDNAKGEQTTGETTANDVDSAPSLRTIIRQQAIEDELPLTKNVTLGKILGLSLIHI